MAVKKIRFGNSVVGFYPAAGFSMLRQITDRSSTIIITDENVFAAHEKRFKNWNTIVLKAGEAYKVQETVDAVIDQLAEAGCDRSYTLVGVGGGVITDLTGYIASIYMRGIRFGFVPTSLLALVDASIGGKNGVDVGKYKNLAGTIRQPSFILHDLVFLNTLPEKEWNNGFAEIIKHAAIKDAAMFRELEGADPSFYKKRKKELCGLVQKNVNLKSRIVAADEFEKADRRLLNFGHTLGHALETIYDLSHGEAIAAGMSYDAMVSEELAGFRASGRLRELIDRYGLPTAISYKKEELLKVLLLDKKKEKNSVHTILLEKIGKARIEQVSMEKYQSFL